MSVRELELRIERAEKFAARHSREDIGERVEAEAEGAHAGDRGAEEHERRGDGASIQNFEAHTLAALFEIRRPADHAWVVSHASSSLTLLTTPQGAIARSESAGWAP